MVDINKIKERLEAQSNKGSSRKKDDTKKLSIFFKADKPGKIVYRCVAYPHSKDPESEPFAERYYHWNIPGNYAIYCPEKNDGQKCALCDFVWGQMKGLKGTSDKDAMQEWRDRLPQLQVMVPGKQIGYINEADEFFETKDDQVKFLKFKSSYEKDKDGKSKMSESHKALYGFFKDEPNWLDWKNGVNVEMTYEEPKEAQKKLKFANVAAMMARGGLKLARKESEGFESAEVYNSFVRSIPNLDEFDVLAKKTSQDMVDILEKWQKFAAEKATKMMSESKMIETRSEEVVVENEPSRAGKEKSEAKLETLPNATKMSKLQEKLKQLGVK